MRRSVRALLVPVAAIAAVALLAAPLALAQADEPKVMKGSVVSVDAAAGTFVLKDEEKKGNVEKDTTFHLAKKPRILIDGKPSRLEDLKPGTEVRVSFDVDGRKRMAHTIETVDAKKKK